MVAMTLALGVAGGGEAIGWRFPNPQRVLWIDGEQSERDLQDRFRELAGAIDGLDTDKAESNLTILARTMQTGDGKFLDMADPAQVETLIAAIQAERVGFVVFDNISTLSDSIDDENSAAAFKPVQRLLARLKAINTSALVVHHAGKNPKAYRGSSAIGTTFERILGIVRNDSAGETELDVTVTVEKFRNRVPQGFQPAFPLKLLSETFGAGLEERLRWDVGELTELIASWRMFKSGGYSTKKEFVEAFNAKHGTTRDHRNFKRDFQLPWLTKLGKTSEDIKEAEDRMKAINECGGDEPKETGNPDF
jgi:hypothetical protein